VGGDVVLRLQPRNEEHRLRRPSIHRLYLVLWGRDGAIGFVHARKGRERRDKWCRRRDGARWNEGERRKYRRRIGGVARNHIVGPSQKAVRDVRLPWNDVIEVGCHSWWGGGSCLGPVFGRVVVARRVPS